MRLWRLLKRLKFSRQPKYFEVKRMPIASEMRETVPAVERGYGERAAAFIEKRRA